MSNLKKRKVIFEEEIKTKKLKVPGKPLHFELQFQSLHICVF